MDFDQVFRIVPASGNVKHVHAVGHLIERVAGRPLFIGAIQDVTERILAEEALNRARSELAHVARVTTVSALTASIAHEVNQPLSGIITNASTCLRMLEGDHPDVDGARETARRTIRDGNRAADVVSRLRELFGKREFTLETLDLNEATKEVVALSSTDLQRQRIVVQSELAADLPTIAGDRIQLQQVILNLLRNASEAMASVDDRPRRLLLWTATRGRAACPSERQRCRRGRGSGDHRQAVRRLLHDEERWYGDRPVRQSLDHRATSGPPLGRTERGRARNHVLVLDPSGRSDGPGRVAGIEHVVIDKVPLVSIVDDDVSVRESLPPLLRQVGYAAEAFSSAEAFLASDRVDETSCLLLDVAMPGMSGPDLQEELAHRQPAIPIVYITGQGDQTLRPRLLALGAVDCLFKPFSEAALLAALDAALRTSSG